MRRIVILVIALACAFALFSCSDIIGGFLPGGSQGNDDNGNIDDSGAGDNNIDQESPLAGYRIVYSANADSATKIAADKLKMLLEGLTLSTFEIVSDSESEIEKEILIGMTNRTVSEKYKDLLPKDFAVVRKGDKFIVTGGSSDSISKAVDYLKNHYFDKNEKTITIEDNDGYIYRYAYASVYLGSSNISRFSILAEEDTTPYAERLNELLLEKTGKMLPIIKNTEEAEHGNIINFSIDYNKYPSKYYITLNSNELIIGAPTKRGMEKAFSAFLTDLGLENAKDDIINLPAGYENISSYATPVSQMLSAEKLYLKGEALGGSLSYEIGDNAIFYISLNADNELAGTSQIKCEITGDNLSPVTEYYAINSGEAFVTVPSINQPGVVQIKITALDSAGEAISYINPIKIGAFFDAEEVTTAKEIPSDFKKFWQNMINELYKIDPTDTSAPTGTQDSNNYFHIEQIIKSDISYYNEQTSWQAYGRNFKTEYLDEIDVYEFTLKCYGNLPSTGFISIPKDVSEGKTYPIKITTCGYGIYRAFMPYDTDAIVVSMNTHGLPNMGPHSEYEFLKTTRIENGGLVGYGTLESDYADPSTAYYTYVLLRNMQALRFAVDTYSEYWNGVIRAEGSSQGGFQSIAIAALASLTGEWENPIVVNSVDAVVPWMCDIGGNVLGRDVCDIVTYYEGIEYFDSANFATLITTDTKVSLRGGYADEVVPPTGVMAIYNNLNCPKKLTFVQNHDHGSAPAENGIKDIVSSNWPEE